ncbi:uncharacterized protein PG986_005215 [Apiospora aurea]|uniref:Uncharacterized protein n=1 Tax=Apiospora aurea TaxID=335848 RepID=A0ABR1QH88_9PEZI
MADLVDLSSQAETERHKYRLTSYEHETALTTSPHAKPRPGALREWSTELVALAAAVALVGAMAGLVFVYDKKPQDQWGAPITLNALVCVLSVAVMGCLLFSRVDRASRGPFGCANLLVLLWPGTYIFYLGAFVALLAVALDPFTQQIIHTRDEVVFTDLDHYHYTHNDGYVVYSNVYNGGDASDVPGSHMQFPNGSYRVEYASTITVAMESAIMYALDKNLSTVRRQTE